MFRKFCAQFFKIVILLVLCAQFEVANAAGYNSILFACFSETIQSPLFQQSVVIEGIDNKLNLVLATKQKQIVDSTLRLIFVDDDFSKWPVSTSFALVIPLSDWNCNENICWVPLDKYCDENQKLQLRNHAIHFPVAQSIFPNEGFVELLAERFDSLRAPLSIKCPISASSRKSENGNLYLKWSVECIGSPVFSLTADGTKGDFLGIVTSKAEQGFHFITATEILQLIGKEQDAIETAPSLVNKDSEALLARAQVRISTGITLISLPPNILAVCSTTALAKKQSVGKEADYTKNQGVALLNQLATGDESDWTHSEYALSYRILIPDEYSNENWQTLLSLSYDLTKATADSMTVGYVENISQNNLTLSECLMNFSPRALSRLGKITSQFEEIEPGHPIFELNEDKTVQVSGFVVDTFRHPAIGIGFKDLLCGGHYLPMDSLITRLPTRVAEHYSSTPTKKSIPDISNCCVKLKFQNDFVNACIVRVDDAYYLVTVLHAINSYLNDDIKVYISHKMHSNLLNLEYSRFTMPHLNFQWKTSDSDVAIVRFSLDQESKEIAEAINQVALVIDYERATELQPGQDAYIVTNFVNQEFVYRDSIVSPCLGGVNTSNPMVFGIYPGLMKGTSGSPVIQINQGKPNLVGLIVEGIIAGDEVLMNFCVSSSEITKLIKSSTQFTLPPP